MNIKKKSKEILRICLSDDIPYKENKQKLHDLYYSLEREKYEIVRDINILLSLHRDLTKIRNRKASYVEEEIARLILPQLAFNIRMNDEDIPEDIIEELSTEYSTKDRAAIQMSSEMLKYAQEVISSKPEKTKRYKKRIKESLRLLNELQQFFEIKGVKEVFFSKINDKDSDVQFFALYGLEMYYAHENVIDLTKKEEAEIEKIIETTKTRETASTGCQILINSGKISEFGAIHRIDSWKDKNWR